jgi:hypothetical protein
VKILLLLWPLNHNLPRIRPNSPFKSLQKLQNLLSLQSQLKLQSLLWLQSQLKL